MSGKVNQNSILVNFYLNTDDINNNNIFIVYFYVKEMQY